MKYRRPEIEVEAMRIEGGDLYLVEMPDGKQTHIDAEEFERHFKLKQKGDINKGERICKNSTCAAVFTVHHGSQIFCTKRCKNAVAFVNFKNKSRKNVTTSEEQ